MIKSRLSSICIFLYCVLQFGCVPPGDESEAIPVVDWSNEELSQIVNIADERRVDVLQTYLSEPDVSKRFIATQAFGSIKDEGVLDNLYNVLISDPSEECRTNAAFALGQSGSPQAGSLLVQSFRFQDSLQVNNEVRKAILEGVGKVGDEQTLQFIADQSTYQKSHNHLLLGQARAIYQFGLRGMIIEQGTDKMLELLTEPQIPQEVKVIAANYFYRFRSIDLELLDEQLLQALQETDDPNISMCLIAAIARSSDPALLPYILQELKNSEDYRIKVNGLRNLSYYPYPSYRDSIIRFLSDNNTHVAITTSELIKNNLPSNEVRPMIRICQGELRPKVKAELYAGILRAVPYYFANTRKRITDEIQIEIAKAISTYDKAAFIKALSFDPINYEIIYQRGIRSSELPVVSAAVGSLTNIFKSDKFDRVYRTDAAKLKVRVDILAYLIDLFKTGNTGAMAVASGILRDPELNFKEDIESLEPLLSASRGLKVPEQLETKIEIEKTIAFLNDETYTDIDVDYNHPVDWNTINSLTDSSVVYVLTDRGNIELELYPELAPGSAANFVNLVELDFYDGKAFHRVVPNFVVQTGCPRGDGYGSLDYTIRSEFSQMAYDDEGYIGMASAGPDTESTQWFITHSPTPHLDARYTIFGKVKNGMDIVHQIEQGDIIKDIRIVKR